MKRSRAASGAAVADGTSLASQITHHESIEFALPKRINNPQICTVGVLVHKKQWNSVKMTHCVSSLKNKFLSNSNLVSLHLMTHSLE